MVKVKSPDDKYSDIMINSYKKSIFFIDLSRVVVQQKLEDDTKERNENTGKSLNAW